MGGKLSWGGIFGTEKKTDPSGIETTASLVFFSLNVAILTRCLSNQHCYKAYIFHIKETNVSEYVHTHLSSHETVTENKRQRSTLIFQ